MRLAKHLLCVWLCCSAVACAEEHERAPGDETARQPGASTSRDDVAAREDDDPNSGAVLCATRAFDPSRSDNSASLTGPCSLRGEWVDLPNPDYLRVIVAGARRASAQASDGFHIEADRLTITLLGAACEEVQAGAVVTLEFLCAWSPLY